MKATFLAVTTTLIGLSSFSVMAGPVKYSDLVPESVTQDVASEVPVVSSSSKRIVCPEAPTTAPRRRVNLQSQKINLINEVEEAHMNQFLNELAKFPANLNREMISRGAEINIFQGEGVKADPSWVESHEETFDGRDWGGVPGSGGHTILHIEKVPTRIVANHLYDNHGSINLVLHERAHSLDFLYLNTGISASKTWKDLMNSSPDVQTFINEICTDGYCEMKDGAYVEAFAELFAYNYACEETKNDLEEKFPQISDFFKNLDSVERLHMREGTLEKKASVLERERARAVRNYEIWQARNAQSQNDA